ncbi:MAG: protein kinase domain-containing protein, partial [Planctomycetota bacterium]
MREISSHDKSFADIALSMGFLSPEQIEEALSVQEQNLHLGIEMPLEEILLKLEFLKSAQVETLHNSMSDKSTLPPVLVKEKEEAPPPPVPTRGETLLDFQGESEDLDSLAPAPPLTESAVEEAATVLGGPPQTGIPGTSVDPHSTKKPPEKGGDKKKDGKWIGPYRVVKEIGRGGMGVVYKAFDPTLKRIVALKVLIGGEHASEDAIERFKREAEAVAKLGHHPGIVPVYDMGSEDNLHYFAMAFVAGKSFSNLIDGGEITPRRAMVVVEQIARALHFAHQHNVLHRDVKPDNILLDPEGTPALTDFGLAKDILEDSHLTVSGTAMGTPQYMPPEQADGVLEKIDSRSDVYSLGATLYEALTHLPPHTGPSYQNVIFKVLNEEILPPRKRNPAVPRDVETICLKALEKDPERRYQSAEKLADDIRRYTEGDAITARPASLVYRISKKVKRNLPFYITGFVATVLLAAAGLFFLGLKPALDKSHEVAAETKAMESALTKRLAPEKEAETLMEKARSHLQSGDFEACSATCDMVVARFTPMQGKLFREVPDIRHHEVSADSRFLPLWRPYSLPVARALVVKARAQQEAGREEEALHTWLLAYAQAKTSADETEAAVAAPALIQIGKKLLDRGDLERAKVTFQRFLRTFPEHGATGEAWLGLAEALWCDGNFAEAREAFSRSGITASEAAPGGPGRWYEKMSRFLSAHRDFEKPPGYLFTADAVGDEKSELLAYDPEEGLSIFRLGSAGPERLHFTPLYSLLGSDAPESHRYSAMQWMKRSEPGGGALVMRDYTAKPNELVVVPFLNGEKCGEAIRK